MSKLGFGCTGITGGYGTTLSEDEGITILKHAFNQGITFFETSDFYASNANEILIGKASPSLFFLYGLCFRSEVIDKLIVLCMH